MTSTRSYLLTTVLVLLAFTFGGCVRVTQNEKLDIDSTVQLPLEIILDGLQYNLPQVIEVPHGKTLSVELVSPQTMSLNELIGEPDARYSFLSWNDGSAERARELTVTAQLELRANVKSEYLFRVDTEPEDLVEVPGSGWYLKDSEVKLTAPSVPGFVFDHWLINKKLEDTNGTLTIVADGPKKITAVYVISSQTGLAAPSDLRVSDYTLDSITLKWSDNSAEEEGFELYRRAENEPAYTKLTSPGEDATSYVDRQLMEGTHYSYKIRAFSGSTYSDYSNEVVQVTDRAPGIPYGPLPAAGSSDVPIDTSLDWFADDPDGDILSYDLYFGTTNEPPLKYPGLSTSDKALSGLLESTTYYWKVVAKDNHGGATPGPVWSFTTTDNTVIPASGGAFKVANSWGVGGWEKVADGFYYFTYEAMKAAKVKAYIAAPRVDYSPRAVAVFRIDHVDRGDTDIYIGVGSTSSPRDIKKFDDVYYNGGNHPYPDNVMVMDITELLPIQGEDVFLRLYDGSSDSATGKIEYFALEFYGDYSSGSPSKTYTASGNPVASKNGSSVYSVISSVDVTGGTNTDYADYSIFETREITGSDLSRMMEEIGVYEEGVDYNEIIMGFGTGLKPPTEEEWRSLQKDAMILEKSAVYSTQSLPSSIDWSESKYFPAIGNQGGEGSCVAFNFGYYVSTFYAARDRDWDLSGSTWVGGYYGAPATPYQDKIFSPDFVYHQINGGVDGGSWYGDALEIISGQGIASWSEMPYSMTDHISWPSEAAWREAPEYRSSKEYLWMLTVDDDEAINTLKSLLNSGYLVVISVDAGKYSKFTADDFWTTENYTSPSTNHANTLVGFDDLLSSKY